MGVWSPICLWLRCEQWGLAIVQETRKGRKNQEEFRATVVLEVGDRRGAGYRWCPSFSPG